MWDDLVDCPQLEFDIGTTMFLPILGKCLGSIIEGVDIIHSEIHGQYWVHITTKLGTRSAAIVPLKWTT